MLIFGGWHPWCPGQVGENLDTDVEGNPEETQRHRDTESGQEVKQRQKEENADGVKHARARVCLENVGIFPASAAVGAALLPGRSGLK